MGQVDLVRWVSHVEEDRGTRPDQSSRDTISLFSLLSFMLSKCKIKLDEHTFILGSDNFPFGFEANFFNVH